SRRLYAENAQRTHPLTIVRLMTNASASQISIAYGLRGPTFAVASACASANHDVDSITARGTVTQANAATETKAIRLAFGAHADRLAVSSTKSMHGHAL